MEITCPRCTAPVEDARFMALSRHDNKTRVCYACGTDEALRQFAGLKAWPNFPKAFNS